MAMVSFEVDDIFLKEIDLMIKVNGKYVSRSEFIKDSLRKNYSENMVWKEKTLEVAQKYKKLALERGWDNKLLTKKERAKLAENWVKKNKIKVIR